MDIDISARTMLNCMYLDWLNNYISVDRYAECNGLTREQASDLIELGRKVHNSPHPES